ncbi:MAG: DUF3021 domain-containing protein [Oscillospiraceae bacterium]|nr:DUF3021 domain-containing protein [Oscillospiraceae bacterium]
MKKVILRAVLGLPVGIAIGHVITVLISLMNGEGSYFACAPQFVELIGDEAIAVAVQTLLCGIMGMAFAGASLVWESEKLSIVAQTGICFGIYAAVLLPIAYFANWMEHSVVGVLSYIAIFVGVFVITWITQYFAWRVRIKEINASLNK